MTDEPIVPPTSPQPAPPQITARIERGEAGEPIVVITAGVPAIQVRAQLDPASADALGQMLRELSRTADAMLIVPNGNVQPLRP